MDKVIIIYTDDIEKNKRGRCEYPLNPFGKCVIKIRLDYANDSGVLAHEMEHFRQWQKGNIWHSLRYEIDKRYRLKCEIEAFCEQIKEYGYTKMSQVEYIILALFSNYNLNMEYSYIYQKCKDKFGLID